MVKYLKGDLLESGCDYICHQVNCLGIMGSGIARQIREKWPKVYDVYSAHCYETGKYSLLGDIDIVPLADGNNVINMYSQLDCGYDGKRYTSYDAFDKALHKIKSCVKKNSTIGFPKNIGCGLGGGDWRIVSAMIEAVLGDQYDICIYELEV